MQERQTLELPNGKICYLTSEAMLAIAKYLRWEIFERAQYLRPGFELRPDDTVIDIGSNIGMFALWAAPQIPRGRLIAIEPNPSALECLSLNVSRNDLRNVTIVPAAAGGENGTMELVFHRGWEAHGHSTAVVPPWFYTGSGVARFYRWLFQCALNSASDVTAEQRIVARQMTLAHIIDDHHVGTVNYLKIDCEGSEFEMLRNVDATLWARIERVVIEYHEFGSDRKHRELVEIMRMNGFHVEVVHSMLERLFACIGSRVGTIWARNLALGRANNALQIAAQSFRA
jgi:FkbM family methyltransferase